MRHGFNRINNYSIHSYTRSCTLLLFLIITQGNNGAHELSYKRKIFFSLKIGIYDVKDELIFYTFITVGIYWSVHCFPALFYR